MIDDFHEDLVCLVRSLKPEAAMSPETTEALVAGLYRELMGSADAGMSLSDEIARRTTEMFKWGDVEQARLAEALHALFARCATETDHETYVDRNVQLLHRLIIEWQLRRLAAEIARLNAEITRMKNPPPRSRPQKLWEHSS